MTKDQVKAVLERVLSWPPERQEDAVEMLLTLDEEAGVYRLLDDEREAIAESRAEARRGEFATDDEIAAVFARYRKRA